GHLARHLGIHRLVAIAERPPGAATDEVERQRERKQAPTHGRAHTHPRVSYPTRRFDDPVKPCDDTHVPVSGRILIVDDEASMREFLSICLRRRGYEVAEAPNGRDALATFNDATEWDVVITDLRMP